MAPAAIVAGIAVAAAGAAVAGGIMSGNAQEKQGEDAFKAAEGDAANLRETANDSLVAADEQARRIRLQGQQVQGAAKANIGASGVSASEGSVSEWIKASAMSNEMDALSAKYAGYLRYKNYMNEAQRTLLQGMNYRDQQNTGGVISKLTGIGGGASKIAGVLGSRGSNSTSSPADSWAGPDAGRTGYA